MEYLFLKRKKSTLRSERQKDLLFKAAERHWDEQFAGQGIVGRKVDCYIYKCILYQLEIRQVFLDATLSLKKLSELVDTNQTYLSNVVNKYFGCNLKELLNTYRVSMPRNCFAVINARWIKSRKRVGLLPEVLSIQLLVR